MHLLSNLNLSLFRKKKNRRKPLFREIVIVVGMTGHGKTQWVKREIKTFPRVLIADPLEEYNVEHHDSISDLTDSIDGYRVFREGFSDLSRFNELSMIAQAYPSTLLVVEESQRVIPPHSKLDGAFENIIYRGRHTGTYAFIVAQRFSTINIAVRSQFNRLISFRQVEKRDVQSIVDLSGYNLADDIMNLKPFEYYEITPKDVEKKTLTGIQK